MSSPGERIPSQRHKIFVSIQVKSKASRAKPQSAQRTTGKSDARFNSFFAPLRENLFDFDALWTHIYKS
jgi:hypothetical protein